MLNLRVILTVLTALTFWVCLPVFTHAQDSDLVAELEQSVVRVLNPRYDSDNDIIGLSTGTGVIINDQGYVATNFHVIRGYEQLHIAAHGKEELIGIAKVVWKSENKDLAILKMKEAFGKPASFTTQIPKKADRVLALGYPGVADRLVSKEQGLMGMMARDATLTKGFIGRTFNAPWGGKGSEDISIIQHSAQINKGNSGGPLFDACGRVVGINTQTSLSNVEGVAATGVFFASDVNELLNLMDKRDIPYKRFKRACRGAESGPNYVVYLFALGSLLSLIVAFFALRRPVMATVQRATSRVSHPVNPVIPPVSNNNNSGGRFTNARGQVSLSGLDNTGHVSSINFDKSELRRSSDGYVVGRHPDLCHAALGDNLVSKRQCRIFDLAGTVMIEDLNATNPTEVNGRALAPYSPEALATGDEVLLGSTSFSVSLS